MSKINKGGWLGKKVFQPGLRLAQHAKAGQNAQQHMLSRNWAC